MPAPTGRCFLRRRSCLSRPLLRSTALMFGLPITASRKISSAISARLPTAISGWRPSMVWRASMASAEYCRDFTFIGYLGPGGDPSATIFHTIEQPTMVKVCDAMGKIPVPAVTWKVVEHVQNNVGEWKSTGNVLPMSDRAAAIQAIKKYS